MYRNIWLEIASLRKLLGHSVQFNDTMIGMVIAIKYDKGKIILVVECPDGSLWSGEAHVFGL
jgi:hypothetical protein